MKPTPDLSKYAPLIEEFRAAVRLDPSYAIAVATAAGSLIGKRAARAGISIEDYHERREEIEATQLERQRALEKVRRDREREKRIAKRAQADEQ